MATILLRSDGKNPIIGDEVPVSVTATIPAGVTLTKAWMTFKIQRGDLDAAAIVQKSITSGFTGTTTVTFTITLSETDTALFSARRYFWDIQAKDSNSHIATLIPDGEVTWQLGITNASS